MAETTPETTDSTVNIIANIDDPIKKIQEINKMVSDIQQHSVINLQVDSQVSKRVMGDVITTVKEAQEAAKKAKEQLDKASKFDIEVDFDATKLKDFMEKELI